MGFNSGFKGLIKHKNKLHVFRVKTNTLTRAAYSLHKQCYFLLSYITERKCHPAKHPTAVTGNMSSKLRLIHCLHLLMTFVQTDL